MQGEFLEGDELPFLPTGERLLVREMPPKTKTLGGIDLPDNMVDDFKSFSGIIMAAGLDALEAMSAHGYRIGDEILFGRYAGIVEEWAIVTA